MSKLAIHGGPPLLADQSVLKSSWRDGSFESAFSEYVGAKYVRSVSSGTAAVTSSLVGVGVRAGDEVITTAYTWLATVTSVLHINAIPVFADITNDTFCICAESVRDRITSKTKAILAVDIYGHPAPIHELLEIGHAKGVPVVEDACQAVTASVEGVRVGGIADVTAFSWAGKPIASRFDIGGAFTTNNEVYFQRAFLAGQHPFEIQTICDIPEAESSWTTGGLGFNHRLKGTDVLEGLLDADARARMRRENADFLSSRLSNVPWITPPKVLPGYKHAYHYYTCLWDAESSGVSRDRICEALAAEGLEVWAYIDMIRNFRVPKTHRTPAAGPIHLRNAFQSLDFYGSGCPFSCHLLSHIPDYSIGSLPISERCAKEEFCLPQTILEPPNDVSDMSKVIDVFEKVIDNIDDLRT